MFEGKELQRKSEQVEEEFAFTSLKLSSQRSPFFYVDLATRYLRRHNSLEISGLGQAMEMVVMVVEVLKKKKIAQVTSIRTSSLEAKSSTFFIRFGSNRRETSVWLLILNTLSLRRRRSHSKGSTYNHGSTTS